MNSNQGAQTHIDMHEVCSSERSRRRCKTWQLKRRKTVEKNDETDGIFELARTSTDPDADVFPGRRYTIKIS